MGTFSDPTPKARIGAGIKSAVDSVSSFREEFNQLANKSKTPAPFPRRKASARLPEMLKQPPGAHGGFPQPGRTERAALEARTACTASEATKALRAPSPVALFDVQACSAEGFWGVENTAAPPKPRRREGWRWSPRAATALPHELFPSGATRVTRPRTSPLHALTESASMQRQPMAGITSLRVKESIRQN